MKNNKVTLSITTFASITSVTTVIKAPVDRIMGLLTNAENFANWNSTVISIQGTIAAGETIKIISTFDPKQSLKLKITEQTPTMSVWKNTLGLAPFFTGIRTFTVMPNQDGSAEFSMVEVFKGIIFPLIKSSLPDFRENFDQFANDLKREAEAAE